MGGGIQATRKPAGACEMLGLDMSMHSGSELGLSTAAHLHVAAATQVINHAMDTTLTIQLGDVVNETLHEVVGGVRPAPGGPGLGVTINEELLASAASLNEREGDSTA